MRLTFSMYAGVSVVLTAGVVLNAFLHQPQFYTACVYLAKSNSSLMVFYNVGFLLTVIFARILQKIFLGQLRASEVEHAYERAWYTITETCLAMTMFRDEFDGYFVAFFTVLLLVKLFHWLCQDRIDFMEQSPAINVTFHVRMISLMLVLFTVDGFFLHHTIERTMVKGPSMMIMFGFEYAVLTATIISTAVKYILHTIDLRDENPWENKSVYIFYLDLVVDFIKLLLYMGFFCIIFTFYGIPLHIIRDLYYTFRSFVTRLADLVQYRRATYNMNERYPDATEAELAQTDRTCIICREDMEAGKKLPCGHIFHFHCLRSWLERQQTCPTCRMSVLATPQPAPNPNQPPVAAAAAAAAAAAPPGAAPAAAARPNSPFAAAAAAAAAAAHPHHPHPHHGFAQIPQADPAQRLNPAAAAAGSDWASLLGSVTNSDVSPSATLDGAATSFGRAQVMLATGPALLYPLQGYPVQIQPTLDQIPIEQLHQMEGMHRAAVQERIKFLQQTQQQITGIIVSLIQYQQLTQDLPIPQTSSPMAASSSSSSAAATENNQQ